MTSYLKPQPEIGRYGCDENTQNSVFFKKTPGGTTCKSEVHCDSPSKNRRQPNCIAVRARLLPQTRIREEEAFTSNKRGRGTFNNVLCGRSCKRTHVPPARRHSSAARSNATAPALVPKQELRKTISQRNRLPQPLFKLQARKKRVFLL